MKSTKHRVRELLVVGISAVAVLVSTALFWAQPMILVLLLMLSSALLLWYHKSRSMLTVYIFGFFFGPATEIFAISKGAWLYAEPHFLGIPFWLPFVWGSASVVIASAYKFIYESK